MKNPYGAPRARLFIVVFLCFVSAAAAAGEAARLSSARHIEGALAHTFPALQDPKRPAIDSEPGNSPAKEETLSRRRVTFVGMSLVNVSLADERFQTVFGKQKESALSFELAQDILAKGPVTLAAAVEYRQFSLEGQSTITERKTKVTIAPLDLSLRAGFRFGSFRPYISGGPVFCRYEEKSFLQNTEGRTTGVSLQGGLYWGPASLPGLKARVYLKWTRAVTEENGIEVNLGGTEIGAGLSLGFSLF